MAVGDIMTVSRLRMGTDGKGVTTLVTFFGCPLHCRYCINDFCHDEYDLPRFAYTSDELINVLKKDEIYYLMSGGGVTFGGGEPLLQAVFIHEVCQKVNPKWMKRIETSLNLPWQNVETIVNDIDEWIIDIKDSNKKIYGMYTGVSIKHLRNNLFKIIDYVDASKLHIRIPRIPGYNNEKNVEDSIKWIQDNLGVEPEVFDYLKTSKINRYIHEK